MEFYEQGKLLFKSGRSLKSVMTGVQLDMFVAAADAFTNAHDKLYDSHPDVSDRAAKAAYHLYRHCINNTAPETEMHKHSMSQLQTFVF